ncbi:MAG: DUF1688 family protein [Polyangiaceae bacterium]|nr:DUF1688 family protein [Polyangiaceae bacterium]
MPEARAPLDPRRLSPELARLFSTDTIRRESRALLDRAERGESDWFSVDRARLPEIAARVAEVTRAAYPSLLVPVHGRYRHFDVGGAPRLAGLRARLVGRAPAERARAMIDLVMVSVLLDAGAGAVWRYGDASTGASAGRSEGLAVASLRMFEAGLFSDDPGDPLRVDAARLARLRVADVARGLQVDDSNPMDGLDGRAALLASLGAALAAETTVFGASGRPGGLFDTAPSSTGEVDAQLLLSSLLCGLAEIWPGRLRLDGVSLGDVWEHPALPGSLVPFHKLSQWLAYSLFEPLEEGGLCVTGGAALTGLPEYRNGGLFVDGGALSLRDPSLYREAHLPGSPLVVEWRACTLSLLDDLHPLVCAALDRSPTDLPLASVLEGGTWATGRLLARERRSDGAPPISIVSDGTVF